MPRASPPSLVTLKPDRLGRTALHYAAAASDASEVDRLLRLQMDANAQDRNGWAPLHFAAQANSIEVTELLLRSGAAVDIPDEHGNTPLFRAVFGYSSSGQIIQALRMAGADPHRLNKHGVCPLELARTIANTDVAKFFQDLSAAGEA